MWDGITPVCSGYDPIVAESDHPVEVIVTNAGPGSVILKTWDKPVPAENDTPRSMELRAGSTRFVVGNLVRVGATQAMSNAAKQRGVPGDEREDFAAVGWQLLRYGYYRP
jgi:hypothetical protein